MSKKLYIALICLACLCFAISSSTVSAQIGVEVLIYTGNISITSQNEVPTIYPMPQEVTQLPTNTTIECIDGVAIIKIGEVQVVLEAGDKLQLSSTEDSEKVNMVCISGEIEALWGEDFFKMDQEQTTLELSSEGIPLIEKTEGFDAPKLDTREELSSQAITPPDPDETLYTSGHI